MSIAIKSENLGKKYTIGHLAEKMGDRSLGEELAKKMRNFWNKTKDMVKGKPLIQGDSIEDVWALLSPIDFSDGRV